MLFEHVIRNDIPFNFSKATQLTSNRFDGKCAVLSSFRLVRAMKEQGKEIGIINFGETRADDLGLSFKFDVDLCDVLPQVVKRITT